MARKSLDGNPIALSTSVKLDSASAARLAELIGALESTRSAVIRLAIRRLHDAEVVDRNRDRKIQRKSAEGA